jgi:hypothetical protein
VDRELVAGDLLLGEGFGDQPFGERRGLLGRARDFSARMGTSGPEDLSQLDTRLMT